MRDVLAPVEGPVRIDAVGILVGRHREVDDLRTAIHLHERRGHEDQVVANRANVLALVHREAVHELHQHLRRARLGCVDRAGRPVNRLRRRDQSLRVGLGRSAWIREAREIRLLLIQVRDRLLVRDDDQNHLPAFLRLADRYDLHTVGGLVDRAHVAVDLLRVVQHVRLADDVAEHVLRRRHRARRRQGLDERRQEERLCRVLADLFAVALGLRLLRRERQGRNDREHHDRPCGTVAAAARRNGSHEPTSVTGERWIVGQEVAGGIMRSGSGPCKRDRLPLFTQRLSG